MASVTYLDDLPPSEASVGWGALGAGGRLGYEGKNVVVGARRYEHALSTHAPAHVKFALDGDETSFDCAVAINDDVAGSTAEADFSVLVDGSVAATAHVTTGDAPVPLDADISGASSLELVVTTPGFGNCHAVWLEPRLEPSTPPEEKKRRVPDCMSALSIEPPPELEPAARCVVTLAAPGGAAALDDLLGSFLAYGRCPDARLVVLLADEDADCEQVVAKYGALAIHARPRKEAKPAGSASLASVARFVPADRFLCLAPGSLIVGDVRPLYASLDVCARDAVLHAADDVYAGTRDAVIALEHAIHKLSRRSLASGLRALGSAVELDISARIVPPSETHADRGSYAAVADPLAAGGEDAYGIFVDALRTWIGRNGVRALSWSFYGTQDGMGGRIRDPSTFPLLGFLHYLIRSSGCARVLETGTAKGVSAACLASAVAHRRDARVVTLDVADEPLRGSLWGSLPEPMRSCIEERRADSVDGMRRAVDAGEQFDAALLDTDHSAGHVWREFDVARRLVRQGGLILIHDPGWEPGGVEDALARIAADGYGVVRLWNVDGTVSEDDGLGLAVVENRKRR